MANKTLRNGRKPAKIKDEVESLYLQFLKLFYEELDWTGAKSIANRLSAALAASPEYEHSIRAEEIRSLIAEFNGDILEAIRCREAEIRKILELHSLSVNSPHWKFVSRQYDFGDVSDRLDLLAILYDRLDLTERAIAILHESKQYCQSHDISFDGDDLLFDLTQARDAANGKPRRRSKRPVQ